MGRMTKLSKDNLLVCDRIELDFNSIFQTYYVRIFKGDNLAYLCDADGPMSYDSIEKARSVIKRVRPDIEPTTIYFDMKNSLKKIISGGQTGADQAGLDAAIKNNIPHGGAIPKGRMTESGILPPKYHLEEMTTKSYPKRTEKNVVDSDGTVIFTHGRLTGGSLLTRKKALLHEKPVIHLDLSLLDPVKAAQELANFMSEHEISVLNVAGSRESKDGLIYSKTFDVLDSVILNKF